MALRWFIQQLLSIVLLLSAISAHAGPTWARIDGDNFIVYSDSSERADTMTFELEAFRTLLSERYPDLTENLRNPPLPVMAFGNSEEFKQFVSTEGQRSGAREPGVYHATGVRPLIAINATRWDESSSDVYRSYAETIFSRRPRANPWLIAGLSEFYKTTRIEWEKEPNTDKFKRIVARIGTPNAVNLDLLRTEKWIPLEHILAADHGSPLLRNARRRAMFYAESWLLVHWCELDPTGQRKVLLDQLMDRKRRGGEVEQIYFSQQPVEKGWLTQTLQAYFTEKRYETKDIDLLGVVEYTRTPSTQVEPVEIEYRLAQVLIYRKQLEQAEILLRHALQVSPDSWMPYDGLGMLASANFGGGAEARQAFAQAVERSPTIAGPYFDHGERIGHGLNRKAAIAAAREAYETAILLDASLLDAYSGLSDLAYREHNWTESVRWAGRGLQIDPHDSRLRAMLGRAQFAMGDLAHARVNTQLALQQCEDHRSCTEAAALVRVALSRL